MLKGHQVKKWTDIGHVQSLAESRVSRLHVITSQTSYYSTHRVFLFKTKTKNQDCDKGKNETWKRNNVDPQHWSG